MYQATARRPSGYAIWTGEGAPVERDTLQCVHCQRTWFVAPGSGKRRGWCLHCAGPTCGAAPCVPCTPFLERLERAERRAAFARAAGLVPR